MHRAPRALTAAMALGLLALGAGATVASRTATPGLRLTPGAILATATSPRTSACIANPASQVECYDPAQVRAAYDLGPLYARGIEGAHETIVIVDAYGSPTITTDLAAFDAAYKLPKPPSFKVLHPVGAIPPYSASGRDRIGWASETSLDVEWAHALAPKASIVLVETPTDEVEGTTGFPDIVAAENYVLAHKLGTVVSQSFGATEQTFTGYSQLAPFRSAYVAAAKDGVTVVSASGDLGATDYESNASTIYPMRVTSWPASDPLVTAVGGTRLHLAASGAAASPAVAWNDTYVNTHSPSPEATGGGASIFFARPSYQSTVASVTGSQRGVPDISMSAACTGVVNVYMSFPANGRPKGFSGMCGTSEATPMFAAIVALSDEEAGHGLGQLNPALYGLQGVAGNGIVPVTAGNNTVSFVNGADTTVTVTGYDAAPGYNLATGLGTINAALFVPALVREWKTLAKH